MACLVSKRSAESQGEVDTGRLKRHKARHEPGTAPASFPLPFIAHLWLRGNQIEPFWFVVRAVSRSGGSLGRRNETRVEALFFGGSRKPVFWSCADIPEVHRRQALLRWSDKYVHAHQTFATLTELADINFCRAAGRTWRMNQLKFQIHRGSSGAIVDLPGGGTMFIGDLLRDCDTFALPYSAQADEHNMLSAEQLVRLYPSMGPDFDDAQTRPHLYPVVATVWDKDQPGLGNDLSRRHVQELRSASVRQYVQARKLEKKQRLGFEHDEESKESKLDDKWNGDEADEKDATAGADEVDVEQDPVNKEVQGTRLAQRIAEERSILALATRGALLSRDEDAVIALDATASARKRDVAAEEPMAAEEGAHSDQSCSSTPTTRREPSVVMDCDPSLSSTTQKANAVMDCDPLLSSTTRREASEASVVMDRDRGSTIISQTQQQTQQPDSMATNVHNGGAAGSMEEKHSNTATRDAAGQNISIEKKRSSPTTQDAADQNTLAWQHDANTVLPHAADLVAPPHVCLSQTAQQQQQHDDTGETLDMPADQTNSGRNGNTEQESGVHCGESVQHADKKDDTDATNHARPWKLPFALVIRSCIDIQLLEPMMNDVHVVMRGAPRGACEFGLVVAAAPEDDSLDVELWHWNAHRKRFFLQHGNRTVRCAMSQVLGTIERLPGSAGEVARVCEYFSHHMQ